MAKGLMKLQTWQIFHAARKHLSPERVTKIFGKKNARSAYTWAQDPVTTEDRCKDPIEALHTMMLELDAIGRGDVARAVIEFLRTAVDGESCSCAVKEVLPTIEQELLADYQALASFQRAVEACEDVDIVDALRVGAIEEIDRTHAKYLQDCAKG